MVNELSIIKIAVLGTISFAFAIALTPPLTSVLYRYRLWRKVSRDKAISGEELLYVPKFHGPEKLSIPRFGGLLIWLVPPAMALLFVALEPLGLSLNFLSRSQTWLPVATLFAASSVGFVDDLMQVLSRPIFPKLWRVLEDPRGGGLKLRYRLLLVFTIALVGAWWFSSKLGWDTIYIPGLGDLSLGLWYIPLFVFVMIATYSGGVIDGLDGLSGGAFATMFSAFAVISLAQGQADLAAFCLVVTGSILAFLWFNIPPARFYMGETGIIGLTATLTVIAFLTDSVAVLPIIGILLVGESGSVIIQQLSKKFLKRKVFLSTPIHHHFEAIGWPHYTITMRFWIIGVVAGFLGVAIRLLG